MRCRLGNNTCVSCSIKLSVLNFMFAINSAKFNYIAWNVLYLVIWDAAVKTCALFLRKRLKVWYIVYKALLLSCQILFFLLCKNDLKFGRDWRHVWKQSQTEKSRAVSWDMGLHRVCVCTNSNLGTLSNIQQIMSFTVLNFSWFTHFLKLLFEYFLRNRKSLLASEILWQWFLLHIAEFGQRLLPNMNLAFRRCDGRWHL